MSGFPRNIYDPDRTSQAMALLGGATAHSYSFLSLHNSSINPEPSPGTEYLHSKKGSDQTSQAGGEPAVSMLDKSTLDCGGVAFSSAVSSNIMLEELLVFDVVVGVASNKDMTSLFDDGILDSADLQSVQGVLSGAESELAALVDVSELGNQTFSLLDFIEQAVAEAEAPQDQFTDTLNPATEPVLGADYYAHSIDLISGVLDSFVQPIASHPASAVELATYLG